MFPAQFTGQIVSNIVSPGSRALRRSALFPGTVCKGGVHVREHIGAIVELLLTIWGGGQREGKVEGEKIKTTELSKRVLLEKEESHLKIATIAYLFDCEKERAFWRSCSCLDLSTGDCC